MQAVAEIAEERDAELAAGFHETKRDVACCASCRAHGAAGDLALGYASADVVLRAVGVQRDLGALEYTQQLGLAPMQPGEKPVQGCVIGLAPEDAVKARSQRGGAPWTGVARPGLQVGIQPPNQRARHLDGAALLGGGGHELVHQALGMEPAQRVSAHPELPGAVGHDHRPGQQAMVADGTPERALGGDLHGIGRIVRVQPPHLADKATDHFPQLGKRERLQRCSIQQRRAGCKSRHRPQRNHLDREAAPVTLRMLRRLLTVPANRYMSFVAKSDEL